MRLRVLLPALLLVGAAPAHAIEPFRSAKGLPSSNGRTTVVFDLAGSKLNQFLEHPYRYPSAGKETRNFLYDAFPGIRIGLPAGASGTWLNAVSPSLVEQLAGTGIVHVVRYVSSVRVDEFHFAPMALQEPAAFTLVQVTQQPAASTGRGPVDVYQLFNFHLGSGGPNPGFDGESADFSSDAWTERGPAGGAFVYGSVTPTSHHAVTPQNPYGALTSGADLADNASVSSGNDAVPGLQISLGALADGQSAWAGFFMVRAADGDAAAALARVRTFIGGRSPSVLLADEESAWKAWLMPGPLHSTPLERELFAQSQANLRMAQVSEPGGPDGQIVASLPPGKWNVAWVRDMAYATVALVRTGHFAEARRALLFQMKASAGKYQAQVGRPYQISVVRYFGEGSEESDENADGPNIEFDGFGLFLWALDEYVQASGDTATLASIWADVRGKVAEPLLGLQESSGLIAPDSSIWEVHWNGKQQHFAYTTLTAANGLCAASRLANAMADARGPAYLLAGQRARDALTNSLRAPDGTLAQSSEKLATGSGFLDAAAIEALNFGLVDPTGPTARATLRSFTTGLATPSGRGFMRNQDGGWYDMQEWIFIDLRMALAMSAAGEKDRPTAQLAWNEAQAAENFLQLSELHDRLTGAYAGEDPMVGFGAGAWILGATAKPVTATCGEFAREPVPKEEPVPLVMPDAGEAAPGRPDASRQAQPVPQDLNCGCSSSSASSAFVLLMLPLLAFRRRKA